LIGRELRCSAQDGAIVKIVSAIVKIVKGNAAVSNKSVIATAKRARIKSFASAKESR
jgi:hypothetical protein